MGMHTSRILQAFETTTRALPGYLEKTLAQRCTREGQRACGSRYELDAFELLSRLRDAAWEPYEHPAIMAGCTAFSAPLWGWSGIVPLNRLERYSTITLADVKGTGFIEAIVRCGSGIRETRTTLILGDHEGSEVFTFHPGPPIQPSRVVAKPGDIGKECGVSVALMLGLQYGKLDTMLF